MNTLRTTRNFLPEDDRSGTLRPLRPFRFCGLLSALTVSLLTACAAQPHFNEEGKNGFQTDLPHGLMNYFQQLQRMSPQTLARERNSLMSTFQAPEVQIRLAMLLGQTHSPNDLNRAIGLLNVLMKSTAPEAMRLRPLVQLLSAQYHERARIEAQNDKLAQQLKDSQQQNEKLKEKLNAIADIENSLQARARNGRPAPRRIK